MLGRDIRGYCKTEASTVFFRRKERLEDTLLGLGRDTTTFVTDFDTETVSFEEALDENYPASGSGLDRIEDQVEQQLLDLLRIAANLARRLLLKL